MDKHAELRAALADAGRTRPGARQMTYKKPNLEKLQAECDAFNAKCSVGGRVSVKLDFVDEPRITTTISEAQILSGHSAVVWMAGVSGCYLLDRVTPLAQEQGGSDDNQD